MNENTSVEPKTWPQNFNHFECSRQIFQCRLRRFFCLAAICLIALDLATYYDSILWRIIIYTLMGLVAGDLHSDIKTYRAARKSLRSHLPLFQFKKPTIVFECTAEDHLTVLPPGLYGLKPVDLHSVIHTMSDDHEDKRDHWLMFVNEGSCFINDPIFIISYPMLAHGLSCGRIVKIN